MSCKRLTCAMYGTHHLGCCEDLPNGAHFDPAPAIADVVIVVRGKHVTPENATLAEARAIVKAAEAFK